MPFCVKCGNEITEEVSFCGNCGFANKSLQDSIPKISKTKSKRWLWICLLTVVMLSFFFILRKTEHQVVVAMYDQAEDGWDGGGALRIQINNTNHETIRVNRGDYQTYTFYVKSNDRVTFFWVGGSYQYENAFVVYYEKRPPQPAFNPREWSGRNALIFRLYNELTDVRDGEQVGTFKVGR